MYFYNLSSGQYSDYNYTLIMHKKKHTRQEFISMYNQAVELTTDENDEGVADIMCEKFGFEPVIEELEINCGYGSFVPVTNKEDIDGDHKWIEVQEEF